MSKTSEKAERMRKVQRAASSPAARKKAVETFKRRRAEKAELEAKMQAQAAEGALAHVPDGGHHMSIDDIPDGPVMFSRMPRAPSIAASSNGLEIAALAAVTARFSPLA